MSGSSHSTGGNTITAVRSCRLRGNIRILAVLAKNSKYSFIQACTFLDNLLVEKYQNRLSRGGSVGIRSSVITESTIYLMILYSKALRCSLSERHVDV